MRLRPYTPADIETMFQLDLVCFTAPFQFDRKMMLEAAESPAAIVVVMEEDSADRMLGFIIVHAQGARPRRHGYIITLDVAVGARRKGVGAALLREAEAQAKRVGLGRMRLHVATDNTVAISFYEREQYTRIRLVKGFYRQAGRDALVYVKQLESSFPVLHP